ncbi:MAG: bifunctional adenosylcobinamide kinase/adenosylcobinamide-phosphate guanylyltransferase [Lachnospiraceae bacterium]|nr:bifunctional adenosylcobinamide kinase/adenosylcobinamide-phosphate guanylyltransferase [Lachnospiraceae bacterium]
MITLIVGEPDSGKSELAEKIALETGDSYRYYLATMEPVDEPARERIKKHREQRAGKGFITLEIPDKVCTALSSIRDPEHSTVLLECISNLVGNHMHVPDGEKLYQTDFKRFVQEILADILALSRVRNLILVTNEFASDSTFDTETKDYIRLTAAVNNELLHCSDRVYDVRRQMEGGHV